LGENKNIPKKPNRTEDLTSSIFFRDVEPVVRSFQWKKNSSKDHHLATTFNTMIGSWVMSHESHLMVKSKTNIQATINNIQAVCCFVFKQNGNPMESNPRPLKIMQSVMEQWLIGC